MVDIDYALAYLALTVTANASTGRFSLGISRSVPGPAPQAPFFTTR